MAQDKTTTSLPYAEIGDYPESYTAKTVTARMIDGLGYRYYWATEDLREEDLNYQPSEDSRKMIETIEHIYGLSGTISNSSKGEPNKRPSAEEDLSWEEMRKRTLERLKAASDALKAEDGTTLEDKKMVFQRGERKSEIAFWHLINGQISDALWHTGQIVAFRRASGNPLSPKVNVFMGKNKE